MGKCHFDPIHLLPLIIPQLLLLSDFSPLWLWSYKHRRLLLLFHSLQLPASPLPSSSFAAKAPAAALDTAKPRELPASRSLSRSPCRTNPTVTPYSRQSPSLSLYSPLLLPLLQHLLLSRHSIPSLSDLARSLLLLRFSRRSLSVSLAISVFTANPASQQLAKPPQPLFFPANPPCSLTTPFDQHLIPPASLHPTGLKPSKQSQQPSPSLSRAPLRPAPYRQCLLPPLPSSPASQTPPSHSLISFPQQLTTPIGSPTNFA